MTNHEAKEMKEHLADIAIKSVGNAVMDYYKKSGTKLNYDDYWKDHTELTGIKSIDNHIQELVNHFVEVGLTNVEDIVSKVKKSLRI